MADFVLKCSPSADPLQPVEPPCPQGYSLVLADEPQVLLFGSELEHAVAIGASAILIPFLIGVAFAAIKKIIESA